ncbi:rhamnan synthesis F family protein, partial [Aggregatibacter actinomycetemcomitans]
IKIAERVGIKLPFDDISPFAAYGTMFWFRPEALKKLFEYNWKFEDFNKEPMHQDSSLAHILERLLVYAAHDAGYLACNIMSAEMMELNYTKLEYKMQRLVSNLSNGDIPYQIHLAHNAKYMLGNVSGDNPNVSRYFVINVVRLLKNHVLGNYPKLSKITRMPYRKLRHYYHKLRGH